MSILIFFIILSALVIVHELGHFLVARFSGIRVDEFGLGYPPRARKLFRFKGTDFTLNWLPFGGFVKIFGENPSEEAEASSERQRSGSFQYKNRGIQTAVLVAGVFANLLFAWVLISLGFMTGLPAPLGLPFPVEDARTTITLVVPGSPADLVGLKSGDKLLSVDGAQLSPEEASEVISHSTRTLDFEIERGKSIRHVLIQPVSNFIPGRQAIGVSMELIGTAQLSPLRAVWEGAKITVELTIATAKALGGFILQALMGRADLSNVTGPVGLVGMVGDAQESGWGYLLSFTALISLNLAIINLLPFPALDGGRLLFVGIEALIRRPISPRVFNAMNTVGFALLIFLMILVTIHDVSNIF